MMMVMTRVGQRLYERGRQTLRAKLEYKAAAGARRHVSQRCQRAQRQHRKRRDQNDTAMSGQETHTFAV